jgi:hypothetical protein
MFLILCSMMITIFFRIPTDFLCYVSRFVPAGYRKH